MSPAYDPSMRRALVLFTLLLPSCVSAEVRGEDQVAPAIAQLRAAARGEWWEGGLRGRLSPALLAAPRRARADLSDTALRWEMNDYAPLTRSPEDRAAAALGLWLAAHGETIASEPVRRTERSVGAVLVEWPGSVLYLHDGEVEAAGATVDQIETLEEPAYFAFASESAPPRRLSIVFTNDLHGALLPYEGAGRDAGITFGALASVATYVRRARTVAAAMGQPFVLLDAGDFYQGTPEGTLSRGSAVVPVFNVLGYDAIIVGNHEYDHGRANAESLVARLDAPVFGANVTDTTTGEIEEGFQHSTRIRRGGLDIALTGVLTTNMPSLTFLSNIENLAFASETATLTAEVARIRADSPDLLVVLNHVGYDGDKGLADGVPGIDLLVGGHTHTYAREAWVGRNGTIVVQAGAHGMTLGRIDLDVRPEGGVETYAYRLVSTRVDRLPPDPATLAQIRAASADVSREVERAVGRATAEIQASYRNESSLGRLATDVLREWSGAEIAILSGGGIRASLPAGELRVRDCFRVFPFGNRAARGRVRGDVLLKTLEHGATSDRGRIQISGVEMEIDTRLAPGARLVSVRMNGAPLDPAREYDVVTDAFLAQGGSGYFIAENGPTAWTVADDEVLAIFLAHIERVGTIAPPPAPRLRYR